MKLVINFFISLLLKWIYFLSDYKFLSFLPIMNLYLDDSWMDITPEKLDLMLDQMSQQSDNSNLAKTITGELKSFMNHRSDIEGAEIPDSDKRSKKQKINFDPDAFADAMNTILGKIYNELWLFYNMYKIFFFFF